ncbi:CvpA family protein [Hydrogenimonas sp. SS33]|uniref:CvpA family protein n=1 Tax=Hydrogenimonas leucolamina TaxID=2954236 RepID=UPI00336BCF5F
MNWFDIVTLSLVIIIGIKGIFNGLVKELSGLIGIILGVWLASLFAKDVGGWLGKHFIHIDSVSALNMIGFLVLLTLIWLGFIIIGHLLAKLLSISGLGIVDRILGFLFASAKVFIIIAVIVFALSNIDIVRKNTEAYTRNSLLYPLYVKAGAAVIHINPEGVLKKTDVLRKQAESFIKKSAKKLGETEKTDEKEAP